MFSQLTQCTICRQNGAILCLNCQRHLNIYQEINDLNEISGLTWLVIGRHYDRIVRHLVHRLKYGRGKAIAKLLWSKLATLIHTTDLIQQIESHPWHVIITAVPTHWVKRYFTRWYNQAELLAKAIASSLDLPYHLLLSKSRRTTSQVKVRDRSQRLTNILNSFTTFGPSPNEWNKVIRRGSGWGKWEIIILVDDIITTWATISECARILHEHHPHSQIRWVCIARNR